MFCDIAASAFGDPHMLTFDGLLYTFNGYGEYWLLRVPNRDNPENPVELALQGRFQQPPKQFCRCSSVSQYCKYCSIVSVCKYCCKYSIGGVQ